MVRNMLENSGSDEDWYQYLETSMIEFTNNDERQRQFATLALQSCVEGEMMDELVSTLQWFFSTNKSDVLDSTAFKLNNEAFIRACQKNDFDMIGVMSTYGFFIKSALEANASQGCRDFLRELVLLECLSKPSYLLVRFEQYKEDPINRAFFLLHRCKGLLTMVKAHEARIGKIKATVGFV